MSKGAKGAQATSSSYEVRDIVLAKVRGFPAWPGMIVDPEDIPANVRREQPNSKKTTFYCVRFFPAGDYAWTIAKDLSKLQKHEIEAYINEPFRKNADLLQGYKIALNPEKWEQEREAALEAEAEALAEVDELEGEEEEEEDEDAPKKKKAVAKKRKRESESAPASKAKATKAKAKKDSAEPAGKKKATKTKSKSKAVVESEDEGAGEDDAKPSPPPAKKSKREEEDENGTGLLMDWRHKLQKAFLGKNPSPDEAMPDVDKLLKEVEEYDGMSIAYLQYSKIGKVMRHVTSKKDDEIPRNDDFKFKERAQALVNKWSTILSASKGSNGTSEEAKPAAHGDSMDVDKAEKPEKANGTEEPKENAEAAEANGDAAADGDAKHDVSVPEPEPETEAGDVSALADVTMSEA
ncbi:hypothetical protein PUNSTDRAFT_118694 [Punctularia strigosozonata HHB-11173 SS5]|uniref:uncharacterized protein n=1 Tax=Punctularia strigosozonata (strain HHB-11173) TaxID=741275 RepID=UPI000441691C|nr:uncharacterized protein PUNSTDRAFT_118694 [Punctularia strigosozonata HHB-11173 SS5]EIN11168.1 hypothetical protein PUNSTDRAFT_118694 [Punctularia strigosozonata HHB-11173 SS5]